MHERGDRGTRDSGGHGSVGKKGERKPLQTGQAGEKKKMQAERGDRQRGERKASPAGQVEGPAGLHCSLPRQPGPDPVDRPRARGNRGPDPAGSNPDGPSDTHPTSPSLGPHPLARPQELRLPSPLLHRGPGPTHPPTHPPGRGKARRRSGGPTIPTRQPLPLPPSPRRRPDPRRVDTSTKMAATPESAWLQPRGRGYGPGWAWLVA